MTTFEQVLEDARKLPLEEQRLLGEVLTEEPPKTIEQVIAEQGKGPVNFDELLKLGEFWPEDESVDDFITAVREWRRDGAERRIE